MLQWNINTVGVLLILQPFRRQSRTVYSKKYAHGFCFAVLCCGYTLTDYPISIRLTSLALWQSNDCPSASKATLMNMDKCFMWIHYERFHNHNKAKYNKFVCIFFGIYCKCIRYTNVPADALATNSVSFYVCFPHNSLAIFNGIMYFWTDETIQNCQHVHSWHLC